MSISDLSPVAFQPVIGPPYPPGVVVHRNAVVGEIMPVHPRVAGGRVLRVEIFIEAVHHAPTPHIHPRASETITVVEGEMGIRAGHRRWIMKAGEWPHQAQWARVGHRSDR